MMKEVKMMKKRTAKSLKSRKRNQSIVTPTTSQAVEVLSLMSLTELGQSTVTVEITTKLNLMKVRVTSRARPKRSPDE